MHNTGFWSPPKKQKQTNNQDKQLKVNQGDAFNFGGIFFFFFYHLHKYQ